MKKFNETPDRIRWFGEPLRPGPRYTANDSVTFALFNNFNLYSTDSKDTHSELYQQLNSFLLYNLFDAPHKIRYSGRLSENDKEKIKSVLDSAKHDGESRAALLREMPDVIQGRLWTESKAISFWNNLSRISSRKNDIIDFIKTDIKSIPQKFQYEVQDTLYSYDEFLSGKYTDSDQFDAAKLHALASINHLPPDQKAKALKSMGYAPNVVKVESFRSWLGKVEST